MKTVTLFRNCIVLMLILLGSVAMAQQVTAPTSESNSYPYTLPNFYVGAKGGYLFQDKSAAQNPALFLNQGYFGEVNAGWRALNNWLGWNLSAGYLNINRQLPKELSNQYSLNAYDVLKSSAPSWIWSNIAQDNQSFVFDKTTITATDKKNMQSWYAMTGPEFWYGRNRLQAFLSLNAGVGFTHFGYYYIEGKGASSNAVTYDYFSQDNNQVINPASVRAQNIYSQWGMSDKTYVASGSPATFTSATIQDKMEMNLMGRGSLGVEYFITPRISVDASASYWYVMMPKWASAKNSSGMIAFNGVWDNSVTPGPTDFVDNPITPKAIVGAADYNLHKDLDAKNPGMFSANVGVKFWLGKKSASKPVAKTSPDIAQPAPKPAPQVAKKDILINVKDKPTGYALSGVKITLYRDGAVYYSGITDATGALPPIEALTAGNYKIQGVLNGIETTTAQLDSTDFEGASRVIVRELLHNDLRFTLTGHTLNAQNDAKIPEVKTTLIQEGGGDNSIQMSDARGEFRFQLAPDADFTVFAEQKGFFSNREKVSTRNLNRSKTLYVDLRLAMNELKKDVQFKLENIYYDFDRASIRPDAAMVLNDVYQMMIDNPTVVIELSSHTDSRGADSYNMKLSQRRADAAVRYLIQQGVSASRLVARGYGETRPVNSCVNGVTCTEDEYQANRRTEIKILKE